MRRLAPLALLLCGACVDVGDEFRCASHAECADHGEAGFCEASGFCSTTDATCGRPGARRYRDHSDALSGTCAPCSDEFCGDGLDGDCSGDSGGPQESAAGCPPNDLPATPIGLPPPAELPAAPTSMPAAPTIPIDFAHDDLDACGSGRGRDLFYQIDVPPPNPVMVYIDTAGSTFPPALAVFPVPCAALSASAVDPGCARPGMPDPSCPFARRFDTLPPGSTCLVVEQADPALFSMPGAVTLRAALGPPPTCP